MPFKASAERRHYISRQRHRAMNSVAYDAALRQRGGQSRYSALAIATALTLRSVFRQALRQTEELISSIIALLSLDLAVPDHTTLSRRAENLDVVQPRPTSSPVHLLVDSTGLKLCGSGEWLLEDLIRTANRADVAPDMPPRRHFSVGTAANPDFSALQIHYHERNVR